MKRNSVLLFTFFYTAVVLAASQAPKKHLGHIAQDMTQIFGSISTLVIAIVYVAGIGFLLGSIFKFKQHKDNASQVPLGTPFAMLVIGVVLIVLPSLIGPGGKVIFGPHAKTKYIPSRETQKK